MKTASANLISLLASRNQYAMADLFTFTLADASTLKFTSAQTDLGAFLALGPRLTRGPTRSVIGVEVDTLSVTMATSVETLIGNVPLAQYARQGGFDGAHLQLDRYFAADWATPGAGNLAMFAGRVADVELTASEVQLSITSDLELLNVMMPRNLYQSTCIHTVYDAGCGLVAANFTVSGTIAANSTTTALYCNLAQADAYFGLGSLQFTSGPNIGVRRAVKRYLTGLITVVPPLPSTPVAGNTFTIKPGCDKLKATCQTKFNNLANNRSFPYIPVPESAY